MADYRQSCEGCNSYTGFSGHSPRCPYGGYAPYKGMSAAQYYDARLDEQFNLFIKVPPVYECDICGSLVTQKGRVTHLRVSHEIRL